MTKEESNKRRILIEYAEEFNLSVFVETGTYKGDTVKAMARSKLFSEIHTIEVYKDRADAASHRYRNFDYIHCWNGDSADILPYIVPGIKSPILFWLDAHHSGKQIARERGLINTPILAELECALQHDEMDVILIDDVRYFDEFGELYDNYPSMQQVRDLVTKYRPNWVFDNFGDIIRTHRRRGTDV